MDPWICDACGNRFETEYTTDAEVCGSGDGPGFCVCVGCADSFVACHTVEQRRERYARTRLEVLATGERIEYSVECELDESDYYGNALASGDDSVDRAYEQEISDRLDRGDIWAWACVRVVGTVTVDGHTYTAESDWLGGCTYADERDYAQFADSYFADQCHEVRQSIERQIRLAIVTESGELFTAADQRQLALLLKRLHGDDAARVFSRVVQPITDAEFAEVIA